MKIVVLDGYTLNPGDLSWEKIEELGDLTVYDRTAENEIVKRIGDAEIVFTNKTPITEQTMKQCKDLKYIGVLATGYNIVDVVAASKRDIAVTNIPTYGTAAVAQYVFALLLELCHHVGDHSRSVKQGDWTNGDDFCYWNYPLTELDGKTMGIVGYGRIGQRVARIALAYGMKILVSTPDPDRSMKIDQLKFVTLDQLLGASDVISLHCPLTDATKGIINNNSISKMKTGVMLINTSRGPLVEEEELKQALKSGKIAAAAVDVVSTEPIQDDNPLLKAPNMIITPHIAWAPKESRERLMKIAAENLEAFLKGKELNVVK